ncbi:MAG: DUF4174 domain-containing protein [Gammaproteobacteria bacterium]
MRRIRRASTAVMTSLITGFGSLAQADSPLDPYRWQNRVLLVFAPSDNDGRLSATRKLAREHSRGFEDRHLITVVALTEGEAPEGQPLGRIQTDSLREQYGIGPSDFAVFLIGKDGGVKLRLERPPRAAELFELIDSMPMRQQEMRASPGD